jgi:pimeloyl-ACP methyl ester carboxylesterase
MLEGVHKVMSSAQFVARYSCVIDHFAPPDPQVLGIPIMILESDNDPLIAKVLRERLKITYPTAIVHTFRAVGHFPYLNQAQAYTEQIDRFLLVPYDERQGL